MAHTNARFLKILDSAEEIKLDLSDRKQPLIFFENKCY